MFGRPLLFALSVALSALSAGCLLDSSSLQPGDGKGGAAGAGNGGSSSGGQAGNGGTAGSGGQAGNGGQAGSGGQAGGAAGNGGQAGMMSCSSDCNDNNECTDDVCEGGACKNKYKPDMTEVAIQTDGDCQKIVCDGKGGTKSVADDGDTPAPGNAECFIMGCMGGAPAPIAKNDGQMCATDSATECHRFKCNNGACEQVNEPDGTVVSAGDNSDCRDQVCMGGNIVDKPNYLRCDDSNPTNCRLPKCYSNGTCTSCPDCTVLPQGTTCPGGVGKCDSLGNCIP